MEPEITITYQQDNGERGVLSPIPVTLLFGLQYVPNNDVIHYDGWCYQLLNKHRHYGPDGLYRVELNMSRYRPDNQPEP